MMIKTQIMENQAMPKKRKFSSMNDFQCTACAPYVFMRNIIMLGYIHLV